VRIGEFTYWLMWAAGILLVTLGVAITWWGLFGDRSRGRRRCPRCWHDLSHTPGMRCSECGYLARKERAFFRTHRRIVPAVAGVAAATIAATYGLEHLQTQGLISTLPTRVILLTMPLVGEHHHTLSGELASRIGRKKLTDAHYRALVKRCLKGDRSARPISVPWEMKYGLLLDQCRGVAPEDLELERKLLALPASVELSTDRSWPTDAPVCLDLDVRHWWPRDTACRIRLEPGWDGAEPVTIVGSGVRRRPRPYPLVVEPPPGADTIEFDVVLERRLPGAQDPWEHVQQQTISVPLDRKGPLLAEALQPSDHRGLLDAVRSTFDQAVVKWTGGPSPVRVRFDPRFTYGMMMDDTVFGASVEILRDDELARRLDLWWSTQPEPGDRNYGWLVAYENVPLLLQANEADGRWRMRVRGDPAIALRAGPASTYWAGEFTKPLAIDARPPSEPAPPKDWWVETEPADP
jgi:hypothetical protein